MIQCEIGLTTHFSSPQSYTSFVFGSFKLADSSAQKCVRHWEFRIGKRAFASKKIESNKNETNEPYYFSIFFFTKPFRTVLLKWVVQSGCVMHWPIHIVCCSCRCCFAIFPLSFFCCWNFLKNQITMLFAAYFSLHCFFTFRPTVAVLFLLNCVNRFATVHNITI